MSEEEKRRMTISTHSKKKNSFTNKEKDYLKYSRIVKQNANGRAGLTLFLTLEGKRKGCEVYLRHKRYIPQFERILNKYNMFFVKNPTSEPGYYDYFISKKSFLKKKIEKECKLEPKKQKYIGKFLGFPYFMDVRKRPSSENPFYTMVVRYHRSNKDTSPELVFGYRLPEDKLSTKHIENMINVNKEFKDCIHSELPNLFPFIRLPLEIQLHDRDFL
jgi:hypothetical protein